ncbi:MAG: hypothetical protein NTV34_04795, partial [Proteobacteria bacterium]|nr:hypothetical protein [Pseudomonadota bacterium]
AVSTTLDNSYEATDEKMRRDYIEAEISRQFDSYLPAHLIGLILFSIIMAVTEFNLGAPDLRYRLLGVRGAVVILTLIAIPIYQSHPLRLRWVLFLIEQMMAFGFVLILYQKHHLNVPITGYMTEILLGVQFTALICVSPLNSLLFIFYTAAVYSIATVAVGLFAPQIQPVFLIVSVGSYIAGAVVRGNYMRILKIQHGIDYDLRRRLLPVAYVRNTLAVARGALSGAVQMVSTGILCISSDWRRFRSILKAYDTQAVLGVLSTYYDECVELMHRNFPKGDCAIDWMADEFLIYVPYDTQNKENVCQYAQSAIAFSRGLIAARQRCFAINSYPDGIDIGIAMGRASYGLSGTCNSRRMLAFGFPVSLARAMQHHVKRLDKLRDVSDHIAVSQDIVEALQGTERFYAESTDRFLMNMGVDSINILIRPS